MSRTIIAIDPGRDKCGAAVLDYSGRVLMLEITDVKDLWDRLAFFKLKFPQTDRVVVGRGTGKERVLSCLGHSAVKDLPINLVDETNTTMAARARYFDAHPPRGLMRLVPRGLRVPPRPVDDFAAVIIAERFLEELADSTNG